MLIKVSVNFCDYRNAIVIIAILQILFAILLNTRCVLAKTLNSHDHIPVHEGEGQTYHRSFEGRL